MKLSNKAYDILNFIVRALLPLADLVMALVTIWGLPYGQEISATIVAVHAFLAIFVTGANASYKKNNKTKTEEQLDAMLEQAKE
jgi:hypothetical protein